MCFEIENVCRQASIMPPKWRLKISVFFFTKQSQAFLMKVRTKTLSKGFIPDSMRRIGHARLAVCIMQQTKTASNAEHAREINIKKGCREWKNSGSSWTEPFERVFVLTFIKKAWLCFVKKKTEISRRPCLELRIFLKHVVHPIQINRNIFPKNVL